MLKLVETYKDAPIRMGTIAQDFIGMWYNSDKLDYTHAKHIDEVRENIDLNNQLKLLQIFLNTTVYW